jgi:hypothetical protein
VSIMAADDPERKTAEERRRAMVTPNMATPV